MTRGSIEISFENAIAQARELEDCADSIDQQISGELSTLEGTLSAAWQGENSDAYMKKLELMREKLSKNAEKLRTIAEAIRKTARMFRDAELKALEIAEQRTYGS